VMKTIFVLSVASLIVIEGLVSKFPLSVLRSPEIARLWCTPLDPLEYVKSNEDDDSRGDSGKSGKRRNRDNSGRDDEMSRSIEDQALRIDDAYVQELLQTIEADMLQSLPEEMMESFQSYLVQLLPRVSIMSVVVHLMMLIPVLRYVKLELHQSIYPYLYLGPLLLVLPFAIFFFGESKLYDQPFMTEKVEKFLRVQKDLATHFVRDQEERTLAILDELLRERNPNERETERVVRNIALARLMCRVDVEFLTREVLVAKRRRLGLRGSPDPALSLLSSSSPPQASTSPIPLSSRLGDLGQKRGGVPVSPFFSSSEAGEAGQAQAGSAPSEPGSAIQAAFQLIDSIRRAEDGRVRTDRECLAEIRALQEQVERAQGRT
jgi:hypothetical protein